MRSQTEFGNQEENGQPPNGAFRRLWSFGLMHRPWLLIVTAFIEVATGLSLLVLPSVPLALLLGVSEFAPETLLIGRVAGAAPFRPGRMVCAVSVGQAARRARQCGGFRRRRSLSE